MNFLDRLIFAVSPKAGLRRYRQKAVSYAAGERRLGQKYWKAPASGPNAELGPKLDLIRARTRQMVRDNPYASRAVAVLVAHQIGTGIEARFADKNVKAAWDEWAERCDHDQMNTLGGLMALAARTRCEGGEAFIRLRVISQAEARRRGLRVPLTLQVLEGDMVPLWTTRVQPPQTMVAGIEFNPDGTRAAYHMRRRHPGETDGILAPALDDLERVPADQIIHLYRALRPGQVRGVPDFAPVLLRLKQLDDFEDAALELAKAQSLLGVFVTSPDPMSDPDGGDATAPAFELYPGMVHNLPAGSEPKFLQPSGGGGFEPFALHELMAISSGLGVTYDQLTGDLRQANYSSLRAGKIEFRRMVSQDHWLMFLPRMCMPIWSAFDRVAQILGVTRMGMEAPLWQPPKFEMIDPLKEIEAMILSARAGFETWDQLVASLGYDPAEQAQEIAKANERFDRLGIILDIDARRTASAGKAQDARQNAVIEIGATGSAAPAAPAPPAAQDAGYAAMAQSMVDAIRSAPAPVVNVSVEAPQVQAGDVKVDVHAHIPRRGVVQKTVTGYDADGRIIGISEVEADE